MKCRRRLDRRRRACCAGVTLPALALALVALLPVAVGACGATAPDANEPNDHLESAHALVPGEPADGVIGVGDADVFSSDAPAGNASHPFTVTVLTESPQDIELQVGASIPGVWEAITWPGWKAVALEDRIELAGELRKGTVLMFLKGADGAAGTEYSIDVVWR